MPSRAAARRVVVRVPVKAVRNVRRAPKVAHVAGRVVNAAAPQPRVSRVRLRRLLVPPLLLPNRLRRVQPLRQRLPPRVNPLHRLRHLPRALPRHRRPLLLRRLRLP
ncbi:MAG: hypothetical protein EOP86_27230, partial [Verrucomicrobiaceae bacterium]